MTYALMLSVTPRAFKAGEHLLLADQLSAGTCAKCPGKWRVVKSCEDLSPPLSMLRRFLFELEPLDAVARATAENQTL